MVPQIVIHGSAFIHIHVQSHNGSKKKVNFGTVRLLSPNTIKRKAKRDSKLPWEVLKAKKWCNENGYDKVWRKPLRKVLHDLEDGFAVFNAAEMAEAKDIMYQWWELEFNRIGCIIHL